MPARGRLSHDKSGHPLPREIAPPARGSSTPANITRLSQISPVKYTVPLKPNTSPSRIQQRTTHSQVPLTKPPARPSSRPAFTSTSRATSSTKASSFKQTSKAPINPHASPTRTPLYNNNGGRNETGLGLNMSNPTPGRSSLTRQPSKTM
ncbi:hypothetical protein MJO29_006594 [Puccinia striiformis f. sp. tritici]|nr:hypothetical protein MJO29_006594 [Puccinia striiformis f. sp. tritici]